MATNPIIIGIDPGYDRVGLAIGRKIAANWQLLEYCCLQTDKKQTLFERYRQIAQELEQLLLTHSVEEAAIESLFWFKNKSTALNVSEARGVIIATLLRHQVQISEYTPLQIKQSVTGYGHADKQAVEKMVRLELSLTDTIIDDTIDALATMICHQAARRHRQHTG